MFHLCVFCLTPSVAVLKAENIDYQSTATAAKLLRLEE